MNSQDIQNLQESYLAVYDDETRENLEFENWVNNLLDEGYDLSSYTWDEMAKIYIDEERAEGVRPYKAGPTQAEVRADAKKSEKAKKDKDKDKAGYGPEDKFKSDWKLRAVPSSTSKRKDGTEETVSQRMDREAPYKTRPFSPLFTKQGSRTASAVTRATEGPGEPQSVTMPRKKSKPSKEIVRKNLNNSYDLYDVILSYLLDEGYADTYESAEAIMVNMSEEWRESIVESLVDAVASGTGTVVGTAQRAAREIPKYVQQKVNNVAGTYERARQRADANAPSGGMTTKPRSREFSHGNQGGKPAATMKNPGPNFGRG